ncbi:MAG: hypothetical protein Q9166_003233 [cf. Caloplaca sp. 2 TL-2023]
MFYARAALNAKSKVRFGLRHIHVLNRYADPLNTFHTAHILKYIFPWQFGLHNVFTSAIDPRETIQPFKDYTLREQEITQMKDRSSLSNPLTVRSHLPRRLRGIVFDLVCRVQTLHSRCAYYELLKHYCPLRRQLPMKVLRPKPKSSQRSARKVVDSSQLEPASRATQLTSEIGLVPCQIIAPAISARASGKPGDAEVPLVEFASPFSDVSAFCRAVISHIIPNDFWGRNADGKHNKEVILRNVDQFIRLRRFESLTLHTVYQDLKVLSMAWLVPVNVRKGGHIALSDMNKRRELLLEFLYYLFDSILIPLVRSNFHVTESNLHKNRIFYFRHDVWRALTEPAMAKIKHSMFDELPTMQARQLLDARTLGFSQIRLLPKGSSVRPIMNLRRRVTKLQNGKTVLGRSINSIMAPVHKMLDYERQEKPTSVGSALFSVGDIYPKLKAFQNQIRSATKHMPPLFFAKIDVQSCFDTIPQRGAIKILERLAIEDVYRIARHAQIKAPETAGSGSRSYTRAKPARKFLASAHPPLDFRSFDELVEETLASERKNTVFVDNVVRTAHKKTKLLDLLKDHVERNIVKIGKKFFRQKSGIPQGSVLSSLLCNCFYAQLEAEHLPFIDSAGSLLLRLIDDFLFITTNKDDAVQFLQAMHDGLEEYGVRVNPAKSLANFSVQINGWNIPRAPSRSAFPYCGTTINSITLGISKDRDRGKVTGTDTLHNADASVDITQRLQIL